MYPGYSVPFRDMVMLCLGNIGQCQYSVPRRRVLLTRRGLNRVPPHQSVAVQGLPLRVRHHCHYLYSIRKG